MRIDDDIWHHAVRSRRHILGVEDHPARSLLTMARREFVADLWNTVLAHAHLGEGIALAVPVLEDAIHPARLIVAHRSGHVTIALGSCGNHHPCRHTQGHILADQDIVRVDIGVLGNEAALVQLRVVGILHLLRHRRIRIDEPLLLTAALILAFLILVGAVEDATKQPTIQGPTVNHDGILLIVASVGQDSDYNILAGGHGLCSVEAAHERRHEGDLRIAQEVRQRVKAVAEVHGIHAHGLFAHSSLIGVAG